MGLSFTAPPHPGKLHQLAHSQTALDDKDPHIAPTLAALETEPILYLPPLLSSLPPSHAHSITCNDISPPYTETHLPDIDPVSLSLHRALHHFRPLDDKYASHLYHDAFNWEEVGGLMQEGEEREWYVVAFRSRRREGSDGTPLYSADRMAHEEAVQNGGLIMYWYGVPDPETGLNLATCIWQSRAHAIAANSRPQHARAAKLAKDSFSVYDLERYVLRKVKGARRLEIEQYTGGPVGW